jgi:hypothetical protein
MTFLPLLTKKIEADPKPGSAFVVVAGKERIS